MNIDPMLTALCVIGAIITIAFWRAQRDPRFQFDLFDLVMQNGRVDKFAMAFMTTFGVTTWTIIHKELSGTLTEGVFGLYGGMWVIPLVAKVVFNQSEMPNSTVVTMKSSETVVTKEAQP